jgi:hypothetical protein
MVLLVSISHMRVVKASGVDSGESGREGRIARFPDIC